MIKFTTFSDDTYSYYSSLGDHSDKGELGLLEEKLFLCIQMLRMV